MSVLMIFLDGFGLGESNDFNPYKRARTEFLDHILGGHRLYADSGGVATAWAQMIPTDAGLGVPGIPQSATGQTTLWTGVNAARSLGRHLPAFPNAALREILKENSLFRVLRDAGLRATFANAYRPEYFESIKQKKSRWSTSSIAVMSGGQPFRTIDDLNEGRAVYHDFTNEMLISLGHRVDILTPEQAGTNLAELALDYDFTLYEYFLTDRIGHRQDVYQGKKVLEALDMFLAAAANRLNLQDDLLLVVSDHGNFENMAVKGHTGNLVPTLLVGKEFNEESPISSLADIMPFIYRYWGLKGEAGSR
ncbi:MAG: metalloenzyme [Syntrophomonas sp.]